MSIIFKYIVLIYMPFYFLGQSISDIKTKEVYVWANDLAVFTTIFPYIVECFGTKTVPLPEIIVTTALIIFGSIMNMYKSGDAKAMISMLYATRYFTMSFHPDLLSFLLGLFVSHLLLTIASIMKKIRNRHKEKPQTPGTPFFPFLTIGYFSSYFVQYFM